MSVKNKKLLRYKWNKWWKKIVFFVLGFLFLIFIILSTIVIIRAVNVTTPVSTLKLLQNLVTDGIDNGKEFERAERLSGALRFRTISYELGSQELDAFINLHEYIEKSFPFIHNSSFVTREKVNVYSLLYTINGINNNDKLPYLLTAHLDVVPAVSETWTVDAFSGTIINNTYIYGRGTIDNKSGVMAILEAVEHLIKNGERPQRTFYLAFGHDEEISGRQGAREIARTLQKRRVKRLDFVLDEGYTVTHGIIRGTDKRVALIGVSEKGTATIELSVDSTPGHSSFPPWKSAIGILSDAVSKLEKNKFPSKFATGPERSTFEYLAPHVSTYYRILFSNMWLFSGLMASYMETDPLENALVRTTTAITIFHAGIKDNVIPGTATAIVNHRIHPSQTVAEVIEYDKSIINDVNVKFKVRASREAHPISPHGPDDLPYQMVATSITQTFKDCVVVPGLLIANTDTRWYLNLSKNLFRFFPTVLEMEDTARYHGNNERISIENYNNAINFYYRVIKNADLIINYVPSTLKHNEQEKEL